MRPIIGVLGRANSEKLGHNIVCCFEKVRRSIIKNGGIPILILPTQDVEYESLSPKDVYLLTDSEKEMLINEINLCDGILIPGTTKLYEYDKFVYRYAKEKDIPILGICGGMQLMAIANENLEEIKNIIVPNSTNINHSDAEKDYVHEVRIIKDTVLSRIINKDKIKVNSRHKFHIENTNLKISAYSTDGIIEALEVPDKKFILGVQWHPEAMLEYDEDSNKIIKYFIDKCKEKQ